MESPSTEVDSLEEGKSLDSDIAEVTSREVTYPTLGDRTTTRATATGITQEGNISRNPISSPGSRYTSTPSPSPSSALGISHAAIPPSNSSKTSNSNPNLPVSRSSEPEPEPFPNSSSNSTMALVSKSTTPELVPSAPPLEEDEALASIPRANFRTDTDTDTNTNTNYQNQANLNRQLHREEDAGSIHLHLHPSDSANASATYSNSNLDENDLPPDYRTAIGVSNQVRSIRASPSLSPSPGSGRDGGGNVNGRSEREVGRNAGEIGGAGGCG